MKTLETQYDLDSFAYDDLKQLLTDVQRALNSYEARRRKEALAAVVEAAREHGFSLPDLLQNSPKVQKEPLPPKYRNPENEEQTWSGRGRKPSWVLAAEKDGAELESLLIG